MNYKETFRKILDDLDKTNPDYINFIEIHAKNHPYSFGLQLLRYWMKHKKNGFENLKDLEERLHLRSPNVNYTKKLISNFSKSNPQISNDLSTNVSPVKDIKENNSCVHDENLKKSAFLKNTLTSQENAKEFINPNDSNCYINIKKLGLEYLFEGNLKKIQTEDSLPPIDNKPLDIAKNPVEVLNSTSKKNISTKEKDKFLLFEDWLGMTSNEEIKEIAKLVVDQKNSEYFETQLKNLDFKKEDIQEIASLMTPTLANLYLEQEKYETAIFAFHILSLKYPEKSAYFANEIKKITDLKKNKTINS